MFDTWEGMRENQRGKERQQFIDLKEEKDSSFDFAQIASLSLSLSRN
jgi:hypothetical protein